jgi:hypothetical protein
MKGTYKICAGLFYFGYCDFGFGRPWIRPKSLRDIVISQTLLTVIMHLYEWVLGCLCIVHEMSDLIKSSIGVKQGCSLSPTLFGIYIDELEAFLHEHIQDIDRCLLHQVLISILLFTDDVVLLASSSEGYRDNWMP